MAAYNLTGSVDVPATVAGTLRAVRVDASDPLSRKAVLGYLPSTPLVVNAIEIETKAELEAATIPDGGHFLVSASFIQAPGDPLFEEGAGPGSIGTKTVDLTCGNTYSFREPKENEIVWHIELSGSAYIDRGYHRWRDEVWPLYKTLPERTVEGQYAFQILDPDKIYDYYAKLVGGCMAEWQWTNQLLLTFPDPDLAPADTLRLLAGQFGLTFKAADSESVQREKLKLAVPTFKKKGLDEAVDLQLRSLGYRGFVREIWIDPDHPDNYIDDLTGEKGTDYIEVKHGSVRVAPQRGFMLDGDVNPQPGETVSIDDHTTVVVFEFTTGGGTTPPVVEVVIGASASDTIDAFITAVNGSASLAHAFKDVLADYATMLLSHGKVVADVRTGIAYSGYYPSSRVSLHVKNIDGSPLSSSLTTEEVDALKALLAEELGEDVLPMYTDIRFFVMDFEVTPGYTGEALEVLDLLAFTEVP